MSTRKPAASKGRPSANQGRHVRPAAWGASGRCSAIGSTELPFLSDWPDDIDYVSACKRRPWSAWPMAMRWRPAMPVSSICTRQPASAARSATSTTPYDRPRWYHRGQQARSTAAAGLPLCRRASEFPLPYVKFPVEPARAGTCRPRSRAYYVTAAALRADRLGADRDWAHATQPLDGRQVSRDRPDPSAMQALVTALGEARRPALIVSPAVDRAGAVDLMVKVAEKTKAAVFPANSRRAARSRAASAVRRLPACRRASFRCAARSRPRRRGGCAGVHLPCRGPCDLRRRDHDLPDHRRFRCRRDDADRPQHHRDHEAGAVGAARSAARDQAPHRRAACRRRRPRPASIPAEYAARALSGDGCMTRWSRKCRRIAR